MHQLEWNLRVLLTGTARMGKSYLRDYLIKEYIKLKKRDYFVVVDENVNNVLDLKKMGFKIMEIDRNRVNKNYNYRDMIKKYRKIVFIVTDVTSEEMACFMNLLSKNLSTMRNFLFVVEEAWVFLKRGKNEPEEFKRILRSSPKNAGDVIVVTHRLVDLSPDLIAFFNCYITFKMTEENSLKKISKHFSPLYGAGKEIIGKDIPSKYKKKFEGYIKKYSTPEEFIANLDRREFLFHFEPDGDIEISTSQGLSI